MTLRTDICICISVTATENASYDQKYIHTNYTLLFGVLLIITVGGMNFHLDKRYTVPIFS